MKRESFPLNNTPESCNLRESLAVSRAVKISRGGIHQSDPNTTRDLRSLIRWHASVGQSGPGGSGWHSRGSVPKCYSGFSNRTTFLPAAPRKCSLRSSSQGLVGNTSPYSQPHAHLYPTHTSQKNPCSAVRSPVPTLYRDTFALLNRYQIDIKQKEWTGASLLLTEAAKATRPLVWWRTRAGLSSACEVE